MSRLSNNLIKRTNSALTASLRALTRETLPLPRMHLKPISKSTAKRRNALRLRSLNLSTSQSSRLTAKTSETSMLANTLRSLRRRLSSLLRRQRKPTTSSQPSLTRSTSAFVAHQRTLRSSQRAKNTLPKSLPPLLS